jgi:hypothetical protein
MSRPTCGGKGVVASGVSLGTAALLVGAAVLSILGINFLITNDFTAFINVILKGLDLEPVATAMGAAAVGMIAIVAATTAIIIIYTVWSSYLQLAASPPEGDPGCVAGVVNDVIDAGSNFFQLAHGRINVVVKTIYWTVIDGTSFNPPLTPSFIWCSVCSNCPPSVWPPGVNAGDAGNIGCSPMLPCYYRSQRVVNAAAGLAIGATVGAAVGAVLGTMAGVAAMAALGCTVTLALAPICILFVVLAILVAVAITALVALAWGAIGAAIGGSIGRDSAPAAGSAGAIMVGNYVMLMGNLVQVPDANGSNAIYFAGWIPNPQTNQVVDLTQSNNNGTAIFGQSMLMPPFCFTDPDANIQGDPCTLPM